MTDHVWSQEQIAAYVAGGLNAEENERLEAHARDCLECSAALEKSRWLDSRLGSLFASTLPGPELEDRTLQAVRMDGGVKFSRVGWQKRLLIAASIGVVVTAGGMVASFGDRLPTPSSLKLMSFARGESVPTQANQNDIQGRVLSGLANGLETEKDLTNEDPGLQSTLEAGLPGIELADKATVNAAVTQDKIGQPNAPEVWNERGFNLPGLPGDGSQLEMRDLARLNSVNEIGMTPLKGKGPVEVGIDRERAGFRGRSGATKDSTVSQGGGNALKSFNPSDFKPAVTSATGLGLEGKPSQSPSIGKLEDKTSSTLSRQLINFSELQETPKNQEPAVQNVIIRSGDIEFVIDSFDSASATVTKLVGGIKGAFVSNAERGTLENGKVKGSITVRVPPENLDGLLLDLRRELSKGGELKGSKIGSQDITKQYTDLESRLKAAQTNEQRWLQIIKEGKGDIKIIVDAEKELGNWRTKVEELEGELRYCKSRVALSTLVVTLTEKEIKASAVVTEIERVQAGVEVEDVDKAYQQLMAAVVEAKGRVTKSEVKQLFAGQFNAAISFEVAPEAAGAMRDRLRQLGRVARLEIDRLQQPEGTLTKNAKTERGDTQFILQLYNLANIAPREAADIQVAVMNVPAAYESLREAVAKATGRVLNAQLNEQDQQNIIAHFDFDIRRSEEATLRTALDALGEVIARQVSRAPESDNVTDSKLRYRTILVAATHLKPRERTTLTVEVPEVEQSVGFFNAQVNEMKGRQVESQFARDRGGRLSAKVMYEVPLVAAKGLIEQLKSAGAVRLFQSTRDPQAAEGKYATARVEVTLTSGDRIVAADEGVWPQIRRGLSYSANVLLASITWIIVGLCVVVPWAVIGYAAYRVVRWRVRSNNTPVGTSAV